MKPTREDSQTKTFTAWLNKISSEQGFQITNLLDQMADGITILKIVEILTKNPLKGAVQNPKNNVNLLSNINYALEALKTDGIPFSFQIFIKFTIAKIKKIRCERIDSISST